MNKKDMSQLGTDWLDNIRQDPEQYDDRADLEFRLNSDSLPFQEISYIMRKHKELMEEIEDWCQQMWVILDANRIPLHCHHYPILLQQEHSF